GLSRHLRRNRRCQCHRDKKAFSFMCSASGQGMTLCGSTDVTQSVTRWHDDAERRTIAKEDAERR
ncbi:hypothetical protein, partial [Pseudomonas cannabina]|uniref:hypothetical protein n=1 Tax=Pseudomonas cannabina TaxID=86840 RepID=UPI001C7F3A83